MQSSTDLQACGKPTNTNLFQEISANSNDELVDVKKHLFAQFSMVLRVIFESIKELLQFLFIFHF